VLEAGNAYSFGKTVGRDCCTHTQTLDVSSHPAAVGLTKLADHATGKNEIWPNLIGGIRS
jgi:hypothetical protein